MLGLAACAFAVLPVPLSSVLAAGPVSRYTDVSGASCRSLGDSVFACPALPGYAGTLSDNGNIVQVSLKPKAGGAAVVFQAHVLGSWLEWRIRRTGNRDEPYAAILRMTFLDGTDKAGEVLGVARLAPGGACLIGFVDARSDANANVLARRMADEHAATFACARDARLLEGIASPDLADRLRSPP
ncbi:MAG: hypothetical protein ABWY78_05540 [Microvirga sp.]